MYGYQWPEPSRANALTNAITFRQGGAVAPSLLVYRHDGTNGDPNFNPIYPFKMRGSVDPSGNVILAPGEGHVSTMTNTYAIQIPVLTNAPFDLVVRCDASATNILVKMDGGLDLNSQMGLGPTTGFDRRDNQPGYVSDVWLGYEQAPQQFRYGPEKFGARGCLPGQHRLARRRDLLLHRWHHQHTVVNGSGNGTNITTQTADLGLSRSGRDQHCRRLRHGHPARSLQSERRAVRWISG